jgi:hypothetical protein
VQAGGFPEFGHPIDPEIVFPERHQGGPRSASRQARAERVSAVVSSYVLGAIDTPADRRTVQMGSTQNSSRFASMKSTISCRHRVQKTTVGSHFRLQSVAAMDLGLCNLSHDDCTPVCLTERFIP